MSAFRVVNHLDEESWRGFVNSHPQSNIFHTPEMFQVFAQAKGLRPTLWAVVNSGGQVAALLVPVLVTLNRLLPQLTTRSIGYGSVLCAPSDEGREALGLLLETYLRETRGTCLFTELRNLACIDGLQPTLQKYGFSYEPHLNYLIDLNRPADAIFDSIGRRTRKNIRHGMNRGEVRIQEVRERQQVAGCYELLAQTYEAARVPLIDISLFEAAFDLLYPRGMVRFTLAHVEQAPAATSVELLYRNVMYGWYGGMDRKYTRYVPNELLMWNILRWGAENGYGLYDFGGAGKPDEKYSVRDFKAKFGGNLVSFGRNTCVHARAALWLSKQGYRLMRHLYHVRFQGA